MNDDPRDEQLARLLSDAAEGVEPADRLAEIRRRTASPSRRRAGWYAAGGASLVAAAAVVAVALLGGPGSPAVDGTLPADGPTASATDQPPPGPSEGPSEPPSDGGTAPGAGPTSYQVFYAGRLDRGFRLFSEVRSVPGDPGLLAAVEELEEVPRDPDYVRAWLEGSFVEVRLVPTAASPVIEVELADEGLLVRRPDLTREEARLSVLAVVRTLQAAAGEPGEPVDAPVSFLLGGEPVAAVMGVPVDGPVGAGEDLEVLSLMSVAVPEEGQEVSGSFEASGANNGFEATMTWTVTDADGRVVLDGFATAEGWMEDRLFPWATGPIDVSGLAPGRYTFTAANDDPSGGTEASGPDTDTRTIIVK